MVPVGQKRAAESKRAGFVQKAIATTGASHLLHIYPVNLYIYRTPVVCDVNPGGAAQLLSNALPSVCSCDNLTICIEPDLSVWMQPLLSDCVTRGMITFHFSGDLNRNSWKGSPSSWPAKEPLRRPDRRPVCFSLPQSVRAS